MFQGRVPAGATSCKIALRNFVAGKSGGGCFDQVEFRGGVKFLKPNKNFKNGSFEELDKNGNLVGWERNFNLETSGAADGKHAIRVKAKGGDSLYSEKFAVKGGSKCQLNFQMKGSSGYVYFICYDEKGKKTSDAKFFSFPASEDWKKYTVNWQLPKDAAKCSIMMRNFTPSSMNGSWFDDLEFFSE